jgi:hypothetical protein
MKQDRDKAAAQKTAKYTPGPWVRGQCRPIWGWTLSGLNDEQVDQSQEANARLIAQAPKMLAALEALVRWHETPDAPDECWMDARDAIAKARGEA